MCQFQQKKCFAFEFYLQYLLLLQMLESNLIFVLLVVL